MTLGSTAAARVRVIVWRKACRHRVEPDPAELAARYGADTSVRDWHRRPRVIDFVLTAVR